MARTGAGSSEFVSMPRRALDALYDGAGACAGLFMVLLLVMVMVMLSIISRQLHFNVPGIDAYAGYMMAGTGLRAIDDRVAGRAGARDRRPPVVVACDEALRNE